MQGYLLIYLFVCFSVGLACMGVVFFLAKRKNDAPARAFLVAYVALSLWVIGALLRTFVDTLAGPVAPSTRFALEYIESFVGRYGAMFALPYFAHRVFAASRARRDYLLGAIVGVAFAIQHVTEFRLTKQWDDRGDVFEDVLFAGLLVYVLWLGFARYGDRRVDRPLARTMLVLFLIGLPAAVYDLFLRGDDDLRLYPLLYCVFSVVFTRALMRRRFAMRPAAIAPAWGLSDREAEVAALVQRGHSNKQIAERLNISPNTVKTHLRAVFEKSGVRSRFELITSASADPASERDS